MITCIRKYINGLAIVLFLAFLWAGKSTACEDLTVRDAAFDFSRDVHLLSLMALPDDGQAKSIYSMLENWIESKPGFNVELRFVDPADSSVEWSSYGIPSAPPSSPVVVLTGRPSASLSRPIFVADHWEPAPTLDQLDQLLSSPAREKILQHTGSKLAVLLFVPANDGSPSTVRKTVREVAKRWSDREEQGVEVVEIERTQQAERTLLSFIGVAPVGPAWAGIVFARGKLMPPMRGDEITEAALDTQLQLLISDCSCLQNPRALGVDLPLNWSPSLDSAVISLREPGGSTVAPGFAAVLKPVLWVISGLILLVVAATVVMSRKGKP